MLDKETMIWVRTIICTHSFALQGKYRPLDESSVLSFSLGKHRQVFIGHQMDSPESYLIIEVDVDEVSDVNEYIRYIQKDEDQYFDSIFGKQPKADERSAQLLVIAMSINQTMRRRCIFCESVDCKMFIDKDNLKAGKCIRDRGIFYKTTAGKWEFYVN
nr:MAG TPA: hypothetical protein [Caudoviricetes sp.]